MPRIRPKGPGASAKSRSVWASVLAVFCVLAIQTVRVHLFPDPRVVSQAQRQYWAQVPVSTSRGDIRDRNGIALALSIPATSLFVDPQYWKSSGAASLRGILDPREVRRFEGPLTGRFLWVARKLPRDRADALVKQEIPGLFALKEKARVYPHGSLASHVLGFCDIDDNGLSGLELAWNNVLFSPPQTRLLARDARGRLLDMIGCNTGELRSGVGSLRLTLDARIQQIVESRLDQGAKDVGALWGAALCMDPHSGALLAVASYPGFDLNQRGHFQNQEALRNNVIGRVYEPGSTLKPLIMGMALEEGVVGPGDRFSCSGSIAVSDGVIRDVKRGGHGIQDPARVLINSCNVGMALVGIRFSTFRAYSALRTLGFGERSGVDLAGEEEGLLKPPEQWLGTVPANVAIGQGIAVSPLQLATAISAIANGGHLLKPYVVADVRNGNGDTIHQGKRRERAAVFSEGTAAYLREAMRRVVKEGTGKGADTPLAEVAGKTGTAQIAAGGEYAKGHYVASFVGFWPAREPRYVLLVVLGEPKGARYYGGELAAPLFRQIVEDMVQLPLHKGS